MLKIKLLIILLFCTATTRSQTDYEPLKCHGDLPADFTQLSRQKSAEQVAKEKQEYKSSSAEQKKKSDFIRASNYIVDEILLSGRVLFNDPLSKYLSRIMDEILQSEPDLRSKIRIYVLRSTEVNAFATNHGIIFVTTGLLAEVENEAQLAFILSHELIHYEKRHVINSYLESQKIFTSSQNRYSSYDDKIKKASNYSKELEIEADNFGLDRLAKTRFDIREGMHSMDVLQFSHLPFDEIQFRLDQFESGKMMLPKVLHLDTLNQIDFGNDNYDDSKSSHPNLKTRRELLETAISELTNQSNAQKFVNPKEEFLAVQKIARYEAVRLLLADRQYAEAYYEAYVLLDKDPGNMYLRESMAKAMYGMAKYKIYKKYNKTSDYYDVIQGESQRCFYFFESLSAEQMTFLACRRLYDISTITHHEFVKRLRDDLFMDLINKYNFDYTKLKEENDNYLATLIVPESEQSEPTDTVQTDEYVQEESSSKYDKLRKQKKESKTIEKGKDVEEIPFHYAVFNDLIEQSDFKHYFSESEERAKKKKEKEEEKINRENAMTSKQKNKKERDKSKHGLSLGLDKVVFVDPFYLSIDNTQGNFLENSENKLVNFSNDLTDLSGKAGLNSDVLAPKIFTSADVEKYNNMASVNFWIGERLDHVNIDLIPLETEYVMEVSEKYNTNHFVFSGILAYKEPKDNIGLAILSILTIYTSPWGIYQLAKPNWNTSYYTMVFNVENGDCYMNEQLDFNMKDNRSLIKSQMYDLMLQMKKKKK